LDFLTERRQTVRLGSVISKMTTVSTGSPQGCVLSPLLFTLRAHDCPASFNTNHIIKSLLESKTTRVTVDGVVRYACYQLNICISYEPPKITFCIVSEK